MWKVLLSCKLEVISIAFLSDNVFLYELYIESHIELGN